MTGYAALDRPGRHWEVRAVNARGFDAKMRLPEIAGLEPVVRRAIAEVVTRGTVTLTLRLDAGRAPAMAPDPAILGGLLDGLSAIETRAAQHGVALRPSSAAELLALPALMTADPGPSLTLADAKSDLADLMAAFDADRRSEGGGLHGVLAAHVGEIADLVDQLKALGPRRAKHLRDAFDAAMERLGARGLDREKHAQDIATLAIKADITEEVERLDLHVAAAEDLLADDEPVGRRFDFLTQELNREANTLCSKAQMVEVTTLGLALKTNIDRLREQIQNVE